MATTKTGKSTNQKKQPASPTEAEPGALAANVSFVLFAHLIFFLVLACALLATVPIAYFASYSLGAAVMAAAVLALIVQYQRIGQAVEKCISLVGIRKPVSRVLPDFYVAGLSIFHAIPLFILLHTLEGSLWVHQTPVEYLSTPDELSLDKADGLYHIENGRGIASLGSSQSRNTAKGSRAAGTNYLGLSTTWKVMPFVPQIQGLDDVELNLQNGTQCIWLGTNDGPDWIKDTLQADDDSQYFRERDSRIVEKYLSILEKNVSRANLPSCTRILERVPSPGTIKMSYRNASLLALSVAHGVPMILLLGFKLLSGARKKEGDALTNSS